MTLPRSPFRIAALALFVVLLATNAYRAATQSIVHDEALTWAEYLAGPTSDIFQHYDANNHFLATILFKISTTLFGDSEFALRLPTLLAGAWFFWTVFRLFALLFGDGWLFLLGCAAIAMNPILLDFLVAARGYGLAMAGLFWGLYQMVAWLDERAHGLSDAERRKRLWKAALGCSIAVAANLTFLMPVVVIAGAFCVLLLHRPERSDAPDPAVSVQRKKNKKARPKAQAAPQSAYTSLIHFVVPAVLAGIAFLIAAPIDTAHTRDFYAGASTLTGSLRSLIQVSFAYQDGAGVLQHIERIWSGLAMFFLPAVLVTAPVAAFLKARMQASPLAVATLFASLAAVGSAILLATAHLAAGIPYPEDRTGIYFVPLATVAALGLARILSERPGLAHWIGSAIAIVLASFALEFTVQWNVKSFWVWRYDADSKRIFDQLQAAPKPSNPAPESVRLGASWVYEPSLNFYRVTRRVVWMAPVMRDGFAGDRQFYVVSPEDQASAKRSKMKPIYRGPVSGTLLEIPQ